MIKGDNVQLRAVEKRDVDLLYQWENDMALWQVSNTIVPFSRYQIEKYIKSASLDIYQTKQLRLIIETSHANSLPLTIGLIDMFDFDPFHNRAGLGIVINEKFRGKGFASEALQLFINYAFTTIGVHNLYCNIAQSNEISLKLFKSMGFNLVGIKKEWLKTNNGYEDEILLQIIR